MEQRGVDMVRLEKAEEVYDVEEVLGRDASSVFPSLQAQLDPMEQLKAAVGAKRFVTEAELEEIKAARGLRADDGTAAVDKPLAEVLAERKKAKQDAFDDTWKQMKTGKNRPLDADELEFYDSLAQQEAEQHRRMRQEEDEELAAFRQAVAAAAEAKAAAAEAKAAAAADDGLEGAAAAAGPGPGSRGMAELGRSGSGASAGKPAAVRLYSKPALPVLKPIVKAKPKGAAAAGGGQQGSSSSGGTQQPKTAAAAAGGGASPHSKRQRLEHAAAGQQPQQQQGAGAGLAGLLGGYGSGSDDADE
ncbi:N-terminal domain of NEFA-interacting nuclear protein NIP30-domain-containing protein [Scenedesmus sp. NREL 46B-D3]|nr:N-terminal domain of NEFA-interacting nuclear protein NIP30-domain-containing protein [Scenedesmus sp. NREL 46B-D3]